MLINMCTYTCIYIHTHTHTDPYTCMVVIQKHICCLGLLSKFLKYRQHQLSAPSSFKIPIPAKETRREERRRGQDADAWVVSETECGSVALWKSDANPARNAHISVPRCTLQSVTHPQRHCSSQDPWADRCGRGWTPWRESGWRPHCWRPWRACVWSLWPLTISASERCWPQYLPTLSPGEKAKIKTLSRNTWPGVPRS